MKKYCYVLSTFLLSLILTLSCVAYAQPVTENYTEDISSMPVVSTEENVTSLDIKATSCVNY